MSTTTGELRAGGRAETRAGSAAGRDAWIARQSDLLWRYLRYLGASRELAEDVMQEVLIRALAHHGTARPGWLRTTARNLLVDHWRREGRAPLSVDAAALERVWCAQDTDARRGALRACLDGLPARSRQVLELRYGDGLGWSEIGARIGLRAQGVKSLLQRLRVAVRGCVERRLRDEE